MSIGIFIAAHKPYWMPSDSVYIPIHVGSAGKGDISYLRDDSGDNISERNAMYCELTGMYWAWKNSSYDYVGLVHYRRHFSSSRRFGSKRGRIIGRQEIEKLLEKNDVILPKPRNYVIDTNRGQYIHAHHEQDLTILREVLNDLTPEYLTAYDAYMRRTVGHRFNMFIMSNATFNAYCSWLFKILFELEARVDTSGYSAYDMRFCGFVAERLLDVWLSKNNIAYKEIPFIFLEKQSYIKKAWGLIKRKLLYRFR